ncbi:MAG TPA: hypothetical protein VGY77_08600 [Gemmataceae bacterium]|jgi:hypothetical protein|nr:hypothetical protein [Gemmataceae bacterium]
MLEAQSLWLAPWSREGNPDGLRWFGFQEHHDRKPIRDLTTEVYLGFARRKRVVISSWIPWPAWPVIEVFETEDASLLFTTYCRSWFRTWEVVDAENHLVGCLRPGPGSSHATKKLPGIRINDSSIQSIAWMERPAAPSTGRILGPAGKELGFLAPSDQGTELRFAASLQGDPFAKMLILAACLQF